MDHTINVKGDLNLLLEEAINNLKKSEYKDAYDIIMKAIYNNPNAPEPHNLLGIWYEFKGNYDLARKHYRIAYVLNPIYRPSSENLERVSTLFPVREIPVNYGEVIENETVSAPSPSRKV